MRGIGAWLKVNGEAIYATRPWKVYAEGPTELMAMKKTSSGKLKPGWNYRKDFVAADIRFTQSKDGKTLYATALNWPEDGKVVIKSLKAGSKYRPERINSVTMLGAKEPIKWRRTASGLEIIMPKEKPCDYAYSFKIE